MALLRPVPRARFAVAVLILGAAIAGAAILHGIHTGPPTCDHCMAPNPFFRSRPAWADPAALAVFLLGVTGAAGLLLTARRKDS